MIEYPKRLKAIKNSLWPLRKQYANKSSLTRDELANERSFLAFVRLGISILIAVFSISQLIGKKIMDEGVAVILHGKDPTDFKWKWHLYHTVARKSLLFMCAVACYVFFWALKRYFQNLFMLSEKGEISVTRIGMMLFLLCMLAFNSTLLYYCVKF